MEWRIRHIEIGLKLKGRHESMDKRAFDFWQDHSDAYLKMAFTTDREERIEAPDAYGEKTGECGDSVAFYLVIQNAYIKSVSFSIDGCINTRACANTVAEMSEGKSVRSAWHITPERVIRYLKTLPDGEHHCAELAVGAFYLTLADYEARMKKQKAS